METAGSPSPATAAGPGFFSPAGLSLVSLLGSSTEPGSFSFEPGSLGLGRPACLGEPGEPKEVVQATISRSRRMWATASSSV